MFEIIKNHSDFSSITSRVDVKKLQCEIWANGDISTLFINMKKVGADGYYFVFLEEPTTDEKTELDSIVSLHNEQSDELSDLDIAKNSAYELIDQAAGNARSRYITTVQGQEATYLDKAHDCQRYKDDQYPADDTAYPYVKAEKNANKKKNPSETSQQAADGVLNIKDNVWTPLNALIEEIRLSYKKLVDLETDDSIIFALAHKAEAILDGM